MGYFGLATKENKIAWTLVGIFVLLGTAFWIPGVLQYKKCLNRYAQCVCKGGRGSLQCLEPTREADRQQLLECVAQRRQCSRTPIIIWALGWLFLVGFSWLPCFYFCCCAKNPKFATSGAMQHNGVQMATGELYGPNAHYTAHPFATQPYGPMPYYTQPAPQQGHPPPPYSVGYPVGNTHQQQQQQQGRPGQVPVNSY